jgi:zinc and cadmium transporter
MANYGHIILFSLLGGVVSLLGGLILIKGKKAADRLAKYATPFAAGTLLAAVFLDLLPEGLEVASVNTVMLSTLIGIVSFFFAERFLHWFHHHHEHEDKTNDPTTNLIIFGDTMHNALDGVAIAAAFLVSVPTGIITTIAVAAHEIPQEIGDFGILLAKGMRRRKVLLANFFSALATVVTALLAFSLGSADKLPVGVLLGLSAGFLLYVALSDLIPSIHEAAPTKKLLDSSPLLFILGVVVVGALILLTHDYIDNGHVEAVCHSEGSCVNGANIDHHEDR